MDLKECNRLNLFYPLIFINENKIVIWIPRDAYPMPRIVLQLGRNSDNPDK